jgi:hypothetical protein
MNTIEIEVTLAGKVKTYTVDPVQVTGIMDKAVALLALRQAFISAGKPLAEDALLTRLPVPAGVRQADYVKGLKMEDVRDEDFASPQAIWESAKAKALKAYEPKASGGGTKKALMMALDEMEKLRAELRALKGE